MDNGDKAIKGTTGTTPLKPKTKKLVFVASPQAALKSKSNDWLARNQNNVSE
jgi:hypothetical protein